MGRHRRLAGLVAVLAIGAGLASSTHAQNDQLARGRVLYESTAGGVGCAYCHGLRGDGDGPAGFAAPNIVGVQEPLIRASLAGAIPVMDFIELSEEDLQAIVAYLRCLGRPAPDGSAPDQDAARTADSQPTETATDTNETICPVAAPSTNADDDP